MDITNWIEENPWIKKSKLYESGEWSNLHEIITIDILNLNNYIDIISVLDFWEVYTYPTEIYIYLYNLSSQDKKLCFNYCNKHLKLFLNSEILIGEFSIIIDNIELLQYSIENNYITKEEALIIAAKNEKLEIVTYLINNGVDVGYDEDEALCLAARKGNIDIVKLLINNCADPTSNYNFPLACAAFSGKINIVEYLLQNGSDINDQYNFHLLNYPAENGDLEMLQYLIENGAKILYDDDEINGPLRLAKINGHTEIIKYLKFIFD